MRLRYFIIAALFAMMLSGCAPSPSLWRHDATLVIDRVRLEGADRVFPEEFRSAEEAMRTGENLFRKDEGEDADAYFLLALTKGKLLEEQIKEQKLRAAEEQRRLEALKQERLRQIKEQQEEAQRRLNREKALQAEVRAQPDIKKKPEKPRPIRERPLPAYYTAKRGETLPLIAAQPDVYNDPALWPLLYRANRDQIKDPRRIWPGQVLRIPRNISREDISEARHYSQEKAIY